jgi:hypothetical protein
MHLSLILRLLTLVFRFILVTIFAVHMSPRRKREVNAFGVHPCFAFQIYSSDQLSNSKNIVIPINHINSLASLYHLIRSALIRIWLSDFKNNQNDLDLFSVTINALFYMLYPSFVLESPASCKLSPQCTQIPHIEIKITHTNANV